MTLDVLCELVAAACIGASGLPALLLPRRRAVGQRAACALVLLGSLAGAIGLAIHATGAAPATTWARPWAVPLGRFAVGMDGLTALFLLPILGISALGSIYGLGYWRADEHANAARLELCWGVINAAMIGVVLARDALLFLVAWEAMALAAFFLICAEEERAEVRRAGWVYLVATHAGTLCLIGFFILLRLASGSFELWPRLGSGLPAGIAAGAFGLGVVGFGMKAGIMPLHVWLPGAHANAPSHVSALMSGVLLKTGVYGIVRVCALLPHPPLWWGGTLLGLGALSAALGIAFAAVQRDFKRVLAYSSIENVGIVILGLGLACGGRALGRSDWIVLGLAGALFHVLNHALFKPLLFFAAGNVLHATGTRELSRLGGLARSMPRTCLLFGLGAVAICGLPPLNGFVSELAIYLGLFRSAAFGAGASWVWAALAAPVLALTGALALGAFVKLWGIAFAGSPRSPAAARAHDPGRWMLAPMGLLAGACLVLGILPGLVEGWLSRAVLAWEPGLAANASRLSELAPLAAVSQASLLLLGVSLAGGALVLRRSSRAARGATWDCGYASPSPRMQYTAASFSELLAWLFDWALWPRTVGPRLRGLFPGATRFESEVPDTILDRGVLPFVSWLDRAVSRARVLQRGPVQLYLLYVLGALIGALVLGR
jgi:hydrogenase-4 component B